MKKIIVTALVVASSALPFAASAQVVAPITYNSNEALLLELQAQLLQLQVRIAQLKAQMSGQDRAAIATTLGIGKTFNRNLAQGDQGDDVKKLQEFLNVPSTGYYGPETARAVQNFQQRSSIDALGIVGPKTRERLNQAISASQPGSIPGTAPTTAVRPPQASVRPCSADLVWIKNIYTGEIKRGSSSTCIPDGWTLYQPSVNPGAGTAPGSSGGGGDTSEKEKINSCYASGGQWSNGKCVFTAPTPNSGPIEPTIYKVAESGINGVMTIETSCIPGIACAAPLFAGSFRVVAKNVQSGVEHTTETKGSINDFTIKTPTGSYIVTATLSGFSQLACGETRTTVTEGSYSAITMVCRLPMLQ